MFHVAATLVGTYFQFSVVPSCLKTTRGCTLGGWSYHKYTWVVSYFTVMVVVVLLSWVELLFEVPSSSEVPQQPCAGLDYLIPSA